MLGGHDVTASRYGRGCHGRRGTRCATLAGILGVQVVHFGALLRRQGHAHFGFAHALAKFGGYVLAEVVQRLRVLDGFLKSIRSLPALGIGLCNLVSVCLQVFVGCGVDHVGKRLVLGLFVFLVFPHEIALRAIVTT